MSTIATQEHAAAYHLRAAEGWIELGNYFEANEELEQIPPKLRLHPDVLSLRWRIYAKAKKWDVCLMIARALTDDIPSDPRGWIAMAETLNSKGQVAEAYEIMRSKVIEFTHSWHLLYDTARYACLLGKIEDVKQFLHLAMAVGDPKTITQRALNDPDLAELWKQA